jgi:hypothetical protein
MKLAIQYHVLKILLMEVMVVVVQQVQLQMALLEALEMAQAAQMMMAIYRYIVAATQTTLKQKL